MKRLWASLLMVTGILFVLGTAYGSDLLQKAGRAEIDGNHKQALQLYKEACDQGEAKGCVEAGKILASGLINNNYDTDGAKKLYKKACEMNSIEGCIELGELYSLDNCHKAITFYKEKCTQTHNPKICKKIGLEYLYSSNYSGCKNIKKGIEYLKKVCIDMNYGDACQELATYYDNNGNTQEAYKYYKEACKRGEKGACDTAQYIEENR